MCEATGSVANPSILQKLSLEKELLDGKIGRLVEFISKRDIQVSERQWVLLELQLGHMKHYASCLNLRIADIQEAAGDEGEKKPE